LAQLFEKLYGKGHLPFPWQERLFQKFCHSDFPSALDLPTGLGKTSVMAIWLLARAFAHETNRRAIPRRLVYVVDRRAVVDQATTETEKLRHWLDGAAAEIKKPLGLDKGRLPISTLRGQYLDNREWLADPTAPAIIVGTVDMIGSRLLFSGYGVSLKMRPYHAGLLGADTLVVLDEAHLVPPFEALLRAIARDYGNQLGSRSAEDREIVPRLRLMSLSATGRGEDDKDGCKENGEKPAGETVFRLDTDDMRHPVVDQRLKATKKLTIHDAFEAKTSLVDELAERACALATLSKPVRVLVYCHGRGDAEKIKAAIDKRMKKSEAPSELLVGQRRVHEREQLLGWLKQYGFVQGPTEASRSAFLVATAAGEVGIDLDADHIVCDLVEWERMVQRLGRVNRRGGKQSQVEVVALPSKEDRKEAESWGERMKRLRAPLDLLPIMEDGARDASPAAIVALKDNPATADVLQSAQTPEPLRPALSRALVDAWSMTSLDHHTGRPDIQPWLRGWDEDQEPQTVIVWRRHLPARVQNGRAVEVRRNEINEFFEASPPHLSEMLETETWRAAEWLFERAKIATTDVERQKKNGDPGPISDDSTVLFVLNAKDELDVDGRRNNGIWTLRDLAELNTKEKERQKKAFIDGLNRRTLVVTAHLGGLKDGMLNDDIKDRDADKLLAMDTDESWEARPFRVRETDNSDPISESGWTQSYRFARAIDEDGQPTRWLVVDECKAQAESEESRAISKNEQKLEDHRQATKKIALQFAKALGLPPEYAEMLAVAALLHDEGKRHWRWQRAFKAPRDTVYAKTKGPLNLKLLDGYRHEFGSLLEVEKHAEFEKVLPPLHDLLLHAVAAHHGNARPLISTQNCDRAVADLETRALEVTLRFERLQKRWGPWGLAWWESLLRAADQQASRQNDEGESRNVEPKEDA
jgi:CRISPR-associated endonuclease/helicase Cas3